MGFERPFNLHFQESSILTANKRVFYYGVYGFQSPFSGVFNSNLVLLCNNLRNELPFQSPFSGVFNSNYTKMSHQPPWEINFQSPFSGVFNSNVSIKTELSGLGKSFNLHFQESSILTNKTAIIEMIEEPLSISIFRSLQF